MEIEVPPVFSSAPIFDYESVYIIVTLAYVLIVDNDVTIITREQRDEPATFCQNARNVFR